MSLEAAIQELTAAVKENTAAHANLADVAKAASGSTKSSEAKKAETETDEDDAEAKKKAAAAERRKKAAEKKAAEAKAEEEAKKKEAEDEDDLLGGDDDLPEVQSEATVAEVKAAAGKFLDSDDENFRDDNKSKVIAAFKHLGVSKLGGLTDAEDRAKLVGYIAYWNAGLEVNFEEVDERVAEAG